MAALPDHLHVQPMRWTPDVMIPRPAVEADDMASVVHEKANQPWIWIAMDATSRHVMAFQVGERRRKSAKRLWAKMPHVYRQHAMCDPDQYVGSEGVMPAVPHRAIRTLARTTNHLERFNTRFIGHDTLTRAAASREHDMECNTDEGGRCP